VTTRFTCADAAGGTSAYTSFSSYLVFKLVNTGTTDRGKFVLKFEGKLTIHFKLFYCFTALLRVNLGGWFLNSDLKLRHVIGRYEFLKSTNHKHEVQYLN